MLDFYYFHNDPSDPPHTKLIPKPERSPEYQDAIRRLADNMRNRPWPSGTERHSEGTAYAWAHPQDPSLNCLATVNKNNGDYTWQVSGNGGKASIGSGKEIGPSRAADDASYYMGKCAREARSTFNARPKNRLF